MRAIPLTRLGVIMDGNRRWAALRRRRKEYGHEQGVNKIRELVDWCLAYGIKEVAVYAFSLDNWKREEKEVRFLFSLVSVFFQKYLDELLAKGVKFRWVGLEDGLPSSVVSVLRESERRSRDCAKITLYFVFNYGGQEDIVVAAKRIARLARENKLQIDDIDRQVVSDNLLSREIGPLDLLIRTSGEQRTSDFTPWQLSYCELYFTPVLWPDFAESDFKAALNSYAARRRRFGGE